MSAALARWLPTQEAFPLLDHSSDRPLRRDLKQGKYASRLVETPFGNRYEVDLFSLPPSAQAKYFQLHPDLVALKEGRPADEIEVEMELYAKAPDWSRKRADKYLVILRSCEGLKGDALKAWILTWNRKHADFQTSYPRIMDARKRYEAQGITALLAGYGKGSGVTSVKDEWFDAFKAAYLKEGGPSLFICWALAQGKALQEDPALTDETFPSRWAFQRRLEAEVPEEAIYRAREGHSRWYRKYASYVPRTYDKIEVGSCWVSDHAQVDVMVRLPNGKPGIPWVTVWRDLKSGKWLGWNLHHEDPNSDHIFQAFYYAAQIYGLPEAILIDNGKDYRAKDFSGGRRMVRREDMEHKSRSAMAALMVEVHFALAYNAQTKPVERDFLKVKGWFSSGMPGYRGGNVVEKPEILAEEIEAGRLMTLAEFEAAFNHFITDVLMRMPSNGKVLKGECPEAYFRAHAKTLRRVSNDALMLFLTRVKGDLSIGRNGIKDSELGVTYWAEWMVPMKGQKVYLRRDIKNHQEAWVFRTGTEEYLGKAVWVESLNALVNTPVEKQDLKNRMAVKRQQQKMIEALANGGERPTPAQAVGYLATAAKSFSGALPNVAPKKERIDLTVMDGVLAEERRREAAGDHPLSPTAKRPPTKKPLYTFAFEREEAEAKERKQAGI